MKKIFQLVIVFLFGACPFVFSQVTFNYTGGSQNYVVPAGVTVICFTVDGAQGNGNANSLMLGGLGGRVTGQMLVSAGQVLQINVGGGGIANSNAGGFNGGANGGVTIGNCCPASMGGGGGGGSDIRINPYSLNDRVAVGGGGGGTGGNRNVGCSPGCGGGGGGGWYGGGGGGAYGGSPGFGGTQAAGGVGGPSCCGCPNTPQPGNNGVFGGGGAGGGVGCNNQAANNPGCAGGVGGALTGGQGPNCTGGGGCPSTWAGASGGGGSNYAAGSIIGPGHTAGIIPGNGRVIIIPNCCTQPTITPVANPNPICAGQVATLTATGAGIGGTYTWTPGPITGSMVTVTPAATTIYTVSGTNTLNCVGTQTILLTVNPSPTPTPNSNSPVCTGGTINLTVNAMASYTWSGPNAFSSNSQNPNVNTVTAANSGNYTVIVTSALGCTASAITNVIINPSPTISPSNTGPYCSGSTISLSVAASNSYTWTGPNAFTSNAQNPTIPNAQSIHAGVYNVTVSAVGGCKSTGSTTVVVNDSPTITANSATVCQGQGATLTAGGASTYTWLPGNIINASASFTPASTTVYTVIGTSAAGCTASVTKTITVNPLPVIAVNSPTTCVGSTFTLTATGGTAYAWTGPNAYNSALQNPPFVSAALNMSGNYTVVVTSAQGCTNSAVSNLLVVTLPTVTIVGNNTLCAQNFNNSTNTVALTASGATTFTWTLPAGYSANPNLNSANIVVTPSITSVQNIVTVSVIGSAGSCTSGATFTLTVNPNPTLAAVASGSMCAGKSLTFTTNGASTYSWSPSTALNTTSGPVVIANPSVTTVYSVIGSSLGCNSQTQNGIATVVVNPTVTLLPNPAVICLGNSINLTAAGASTYTWSPNIALTTTLGPNTTANPLVTTTYSVLGSQATCTHVAAITVTVLGLPSVTVTPSSPTLCMNNYNGSPNTVSLTASGASSFTWGPIVGLTTNTLNGPVVIGTSNGMPVITGTIIGANGTCTNMATFTLNAVANPIIAVSTASMCTGTSVNLTAVGANTYTWSPATALNTTNGPSVIANPTVTTLYSVIGSSVGCNSQTQNGSAIVVPNPTITILPNPAVICLGNSINLTAAGATNYTWSPNIALTTTLGSNTTANPIVNTVYTVIGEAATCTNVAAITVTVLGLPSITVTPSSPTLCMNSYNGSPNTISLTAAGAASYTWGPIVGLTLNTFNGSSVIGTSDGFSSIGTGTVIGANGTCTNVSTFTVNAIANPAIAVSSGSMCYGTSVILNAFNAVTYTWSPSASLNTSVGNAVIASPTITTVYSVIGSSVGCNSQTQNGSAVVVANPTVSIAPLTPTICFGSSINLTANGAVNYTWSPNTAISSTVGANVTVNPTVTTVYSIIGEAATCTNTAAQTVTVIPIPIITIGLSNASMCMNNYNGSVNSINVTANGATSYNWTGFTGIANNTSSGPNVIVTAIPNSPVGTGTVVGMVGTCTSSASFTVVAIPNPIIAVPSASMCFGTSATLNASGASTYVWSPSATLNSSTGSQVIASPNMNTVYSVVGTSLNCNSPTETATVTVVANPVIIISPVTPTICAGQSIGLTAFGATNYTWSPAASLNTSTGNIVSASPMVTTNYLVLGEAATCTSTAVRQVLVIPLPQLQVMSERTAICVGEQISLNANGATSYTWIPSAGLSTAYSNFVVASPNVSTPYVVVGNNGMCTATLAVPIAVVQKPVLELSTSHPRICIGQNSMIFASGAQGYSWTPTGIANETNTTSAVVSPSVSTNYTITGYNYAGTFACPFTKEILIEIVPQVTATINNSVAICEGESVKLISGGSNTYVWSPITDLDNPYASSPYANPKSTTVYTVQVSDGGYCGTTATVLVKVTPQPTVDAGPDATYNLDDPMYLNARGTGTLTWILGEGILCHDCPNSQITPSNSGCYLIQTVTKDGCKATDEVCIEVTKESNIYIPNIFTPNFDGNNDVFLVYGTGITKIEMFIFDRWGAKLYTSTDQLKGWDGTFKGIESKQDVYTYLVNYTTLDNKKHTKTGHVTLMK